MPLDKFPLVVKNFKGNLRNDLSSAAGEESQDETPFDYFLDSQNLEFLKKGGIRSRRGMEAYLSLQVEGKPIQFWKIENLNGVPQVDRWLILTWDGVQGAFYDTQVAAPATNPILIRADLKYAFVLNAFGRMYITPWIRLAEPLSTQPVFVYNGNYNVRSTKSPLPVVGAFAGAAAAGGNATPGLHLCSVVFETDSGFISGVPTGHLTTPLAITTTGTNATINFSNLPVGPAGAGVIKRHIIVTKVVVNNNGQAFRGYEPFIAVTVNDNTTTTAVFNRPDSALVDSAKDFFDENTLVPPCVSLATFGNRLVYVGPKGIEVNDSIIVSPAGSPEQVKIETVSGLFKSKDVIVVGEGYSGGPMCAAELNNILNVFKEDSTFGIIANDEVDPTEWQKPFTIDGGKGAFPFGICKVGNNPGFTQDDSILVLGGHGLSFFNGRFAQNSLMDGILEGININDLKWGKVLNEPIRKMLFIRQGDPANDVLADGVTINNLIYVGNYYYGFDIDKLRWTAYTYPNVPNVYGQITVYDIELRAPGTPGSTGHPEWFNVVYSLLTILHQTQNLDLSYNAFHLSESDNKSDFEKTVNPAIYPSWYFESGYTPNQNGEVYTFGPMKLRIATYYSAGTGNLTITVSKAGLDDTAFTTVGTFSGTVNPKKYYSLNLNHVGEQIRIRVSGQNLSYIQRLILSAIERGKERPRV